MRCEKAQEVFSDYLEGTLERPMRFTLEHHLASCHACGRDYERFRETWDMMEALPEVEAPVGLRESVMAEVQAQQAAKQRRSPSFDLLSILGAKVQVRAVAAAAAVVVFAVMLFQITPHQQVTVLNPAVSELPKVGQIADNGGVIWQAHLSDPGLNISVSGNPNGDRLVYTIDLKPNRNVPIRAEAYLMDQGLPVFTTQTLEASDEVFNRVLGPKESGTISVVMREDGDSDVVYLVWDYNSVTKSEAVFLPASLTTTGLAYAPFSLIDASVFEALQRISTTYGVVVLVDANISGRIAQVDLAYEEVQSAFQRTLKGQPLRSKQLATNVYMVERKLP